MYQYLLMLLILSLFGFHHVLTEVMVLSAIVCEFTGDSYRSTGDVVEYSNFEGNVSFHSLHDLHDNDC